MTYRPEKLTPDEKAKQERSTYLRWSDELAKKGPFGPSARELLNDPQIRKFLLPSLKLSEGDDAAAIAIGSLGTFWVLDPSDEDVGIWAANLIANEDLRKAQAGGYPMVTGFYARIGEIPPPDVMRDKFRSLPFQRQARDAYFAVYPDPEKNKPAAAPPPVIKPIQRPTLELTVIDNEIVANKTAEESAEDEAHPGVPLAGLGAWERFLGEKKPKDVGLPRPILAFNEDTGEVTPAVEEYESVRDAAQKGVRGAHEAL